MDFIDIMRNYVNKLVGRQQDFLELLQNQDISEVKNKMQCGYAEGIKTLKEYNADTHEVMKRPPKIVKRGGREVPQEVWKLPIPYQQYINEIALVFLYGQPVQWTQESNGTDKAFERFKEVLKDTRWDSKVRQCKRIAGAEKQSAMLFRVFQNDEGEADVQIRVLAASKGDKIYVKRDIYENIIAIAWGYQTKNAQDEAVEHFDIYTKQIVYRCTQKAIGWDVQQESNLVGKIPIILFEQEKEWEGADQLINRIEQIQSRSADTNDYFADPMLVLAADSIKNLPTNKDANKTLFVRSGDDPSKAAYYLTWDSMPESKRNEIETLHKNILQFTLTPDITLDSLKAVSQLSAKALRTVMMLADIKANKHKELHDELLDRTANLIKAIIGNVLDVSLHQQIENLEVRHEWSEPFGEDIASDLDNIIKSFDAGILSEQSAIEMNPIVRNPILEKDRLDEEAEEKAKKQQELFGQFDSQGEDEDFKQGTAQSTNNKLKDEEE